VRPNARRSELCRHREAQRSLIMADAANANANAEQLSPDSVAARLADPATRLATLDTLEAHAGPHDAALSFAAAPALSDLQCLDASEVDHALFQRVGLLRARLVEEAADSAAVWGAAYSDGRFSKLNRAPSVVRQLLSKPVAELDQRDAMSYACWQRNWFEGMMREADSAFECAGIDVMGLYAMLFAEHPLISR
jgi:hypothetical protein